MAPSNSGLVVALICAALATPLAADLQADGDVHPARMDARGFMDTTEGFMALAAQDQPEVLRFLQDFRAYNVHEVLKHHMAVAKAKAKAKTKATAKELKVKAKAMAKGKTKGKKRAAVYQHGVNLRHVYQYAKAARSYNKFSKGKSRLFRDLLALQWLLHRGAKKLPRVVYATGGPNKIHAEIYPNSPGGRSVVKTLKQATKINKFVVRRTSSHMYFSNNEQWTRYWHGIKGLSDGKFAVNFHAKITLTKSGWYRFWTVSDDGSLLYVDGEKVVDNDGKHHMRTRGGRIRLRKGKHKVRVQYVGAGGVSGLHVIWQGVDFPQQRFPQMASVEMLQQMMMTRYLRQVYVGCVKARKGVVATCAGHMCKYHNTCSSSRHVNECSKVGHGVKKKRFNANWYSKNPMQRHGYFSKHCVHARKRGFDRCQRVQRKAYKQCHRIMSGTTHTFTKMLLKTDKQSKSKIVHAALLAKAHERRNKGRAIQQRQAKQLARAKQHALTALSKATARASTKAAVNDAVTPLLHHALPLGWEDKMKGMAARRSLSSLDKHGRQDAKLSLYKQQHKLYESALYEE